MDDDYLNLRYTRFDLDYFVLHGDFNNCFAVHFDTNPEIVKRLLAAMKSYTLGYKDINYFYEKYKDNWEVNGRDAFSEGVINSYKLLSPHIKVIDKLINSLNNIDKSINVGRFAVITGVTRLKNTILSISSLISKGFHFEVISLIRLLLEQSAWYNSIYNETDSSFLDLQPQKCISDLKKFIPDAGRLYGLLSKYIHVVPETTLEFVELDEEDIKDNMEDGDIGHSVHLSNDEFRYKSLLLYFKTANVLFLVIEKAFEKYQIDFNFEKEIKELEKSIDKIKDMCKD